MRGALTNSYEWWFLLLSVNSTGKGASCRILGRSYSVTPVEGGVDLVIPEMPPDLIAGILASWVCCQLLRFFSCTHILQDQT